MPNLALTLRFNGSGYHGWQRQKNAVTVEQMMSNAITNITGASSDIIGCSRTDTGVHALEYVCNFRSETSIPVHGMPFALNTKLPSDIRVLKCSVAGDDFHARFSAKSKTYIYKAYNSQISDPFLENFAYHYPYKLNLEKMKKAARHFVGQHDFSAFMAAGGSQKTTVRTVKELEVTQSGKLFNFKITANAYLYNMVRIIVGTLLYVGCGKIDEANITEIILSRDRERSGITAASMGLYLASVNYGGCYEK